VAARTEGLTTTPWTTLSTYDLLAASVESVGVPKFAILLVAKLTIPVFDVS